MELQNYKKGVSVLMPAYNSAKYIDQAIQSILAQTFSNFELIIINDGSTDNTHQVISSFSDERIKYYQNNGNKGLIYTRNKLIELSNFEFIAFLDSDDLAENTRLEKQYNILLTNDTLSFVSSSFYMIDEKNKIINEDNSYSLDSKNLKVISLFLNPVATSSVMIKKSHLPKEIFRVDYPVCEDYDLWTRIMVTGKGLVLIDFLTKYRVYTESICKQQPDNIIDRRNHIVLNQLEYYFQNQYSKEEAQLHLSLVDFSLKNNIEDLPALQFWIQKLITLNKQQQHFDEQILKQVLYERVLKKYLRLSAYNFSVYQSLLVIKKLLQPKLTFELQKKEVAILAFSVLRNKFIQS